MKSAKTTNYLAIWEKIKLHMYLIPLTKIKLQMDQLSKCVRWGSWEAIHISVQVTSGLIKEKNMTMRWNQDCQEKYQ